MGIIYSSTFTNIEWYIYYKIRQNYFKLFVYIDSAWIETDNAHVNVLNRGDLSSLTWLQSPVITNENSDNPNLDTCTVHYASLNFRDIMLGKMNVEEDG